MTSADGRECPLCGGTYPFTKFKRHLQEDCPSGEGETDSGNVDDAQSGSERGQSLVGGVGPR